MFKSPSLKSKRWKNGVCAIHYLPLQMYNVESTCSSFNPITSEKTSSADIAGVQSVKGVFWGFIIFTCPIILSALTIGTSPPEKLLFNPSVIGKTRYFYHRFQQEIGRGKFA
jgi:hypothetical protein